MAHTLDQGRRPRPAIPRFGGTGVRATCRDRSLRWSLPSAAKPQAVSRVVTDRAPVTVRHDTGHRPRPPQATASHTYVSDLRRALVVIKWVYNSPETNPRPQIPRRAVFVLPDTAVDSKAEEIVSSDGLA